MERTEKAEIGRKREGRGRENRKDRKDREERRKGGREEGRKPSVGSEVH